jgi:hypothetical protein
MNMADEMEQTRRRAARFLEQMGFPDAPLGRLIGGANNRVYQVQGETGLAVLKVYFQHPADPRNRFDAERRFYALLQQREIHAAPAALAWDESERLALFEWINGRKPAAATSELVQQALRFVEQLNSARARLIETAERSARSSSGGQFAEPSEPSVSDPIPNASEACFSIVEHWQTVDRRILRLDQIQPETDLDREAARFAREELAPYWGELKEEQRRTCRGLRSFERPLPNSARCLSPSDFGFHNCLVDLDGTARFFDFEYAGWDDPAKLICDFFCQPRAPVPMDHWGTMADVFRQAAWTDAELSERALWLLPVYRVKWCCIMLNSFVPGDRERRNFAQGPDALETTKAVQLEKARAALEEAKRRP